MLSYFILDLSLRFIMQLSLVFWFSMRGIFPPLMGLASMYGCSVGCVYSDLIWLSGGWHSLFLVIHPALYLAMPPSALPVLSFLLLWLWALLWACSDQCGVDGSHGSQFWAGILRSTLSLACSLSSVPLCRKPQRVAASSSWDTEWRDRGSPTESNCAQEHSQRGNMQARNTFVL